MDFRFNTCVKRLIEIEGGYVDHPDDPGGQTKFGISQHAYTGLNIAAITRKEAKQIYHKDYWVACCCEDLLPGLDWMVFDTAVNQGVVTAAKILQSVLRVTEDGIIGPVTMNALNRIHATYDLAKIIDQYAAKRGVLYGSVQHFGTFGVGWMRRLMRVHREALEEM